MSDAPNQIVKLQDPSPVPQGPSTLIMAFRWVAVLPAAVGACAAIQLLIILGDAIMEERHAAWFMQLVNSVAGAYAFVAAGAYTAPRYQFVVGVILGVLVAVGMTVLLYFSFWIETSSPWWWLLLCGVLCVVGAVVAVSQLKEEKCQLK